MQVEHLITAPFGDDSLVIDDVTLTNLSPNSITFSHYEYWDINHAQLLIEWFRTGYAAPLGDRRRNDLNSLFWNYVRS